MSACVSITEQAREHAQQQTSFEQTLSSSSAGSYLSLDYEKAVAQLGQIPCGY